MTLRRQPNTTEKLATMVALHLGLDRDRLKAMSAEQVCGLVQWDHYPVAFNTGRDLGWPATAIHHPSNLQPLGAAEHGEKTRTHDTPASAKGKRLSKAHAEFRRKILAKSGGEGEPAREPQRARLAGRRFAGWRKFNGTPVRARDNREAK